MLEVLKVKERGYWGMTSVLTVPTHVRNGCLQRCAQIFVGIWWGSLESQLCREGTSRRVRDLLGALEEYQARIFPSNEGFRKVKHVSFLHIRQLQSIVSLQLFQAVFSMS